MTTLLDAPATAKAGERRNDANALAPVDLPCLRTDPASPAVIAGRIRDIRGQCAGFAATLTGRGDLTGKRLTVWLRDYATVDPVTVAEWEDLRGRLSLAVKAAKREAGWPE